MRLLQIIFVLPLLILEIGPAVAADALKIVLLPYTNPIALMKVHAPLRAHLERYLGRPVELFTSAGFPEHFADIQNGEFDMAITGPHFGAWAVNHGHHALLRYDTTLAPVLAVRKGGAITKPEDLRGKTVALSNRLSTSSLSGEYWLDQQGLKAGQDYRIQVSPTHTTAIMAVVMGEADAAITTHTPIMQAPEDVRAAIAEIVAPFGVPHLFTIGGPRLTASEAAHIKAALRSFEQSDAGKVFFAETGYRAYVDLSQADVAKLDPVVEMLFRALGAPKP